MTKSATLIIGDRPEALLERHRAAYGDVLADVTDRLRQLATEIAEAPFPGGLDPSRELRGTLVLDLAIAQLFGDAPHWVYDRQNPPPQQHILHNHVLRDDGRIIAAFRISDTEGTDDKPAGYWHNNPFDHWWRPQIAYLPLRRDHAAWPYHPRTETPSKQPYWAGYPSSNSATLRDVDLTPITQARRDTTADLLARASAALQVSGMDGGHDWLPRFRSDGWLHEENEGYFRQDKVRVLCDALPDHASRIDFLLLDEDDLWLYADWGALPVAGLITKDGYCSATTARTDDDPAGALFRQIAGTGRDFLTALRDAWTEAAPDQMVSVYQTHE